VIYAMQGHDRQLHLEECKEPENGSSLNQFVFIFLYALYERGKNMMLVEALYQGNGSLHTQKQSKHCMKVFVP
jgi:hypothetical protein